jgi:MFS family permease
MTAVSPPSRVSIGRGKPGLLFATLMLGLMSQGLAFTAFAAALPQMARDFGARGEFIAQMVMGLAALGLMVGALASGWILERAGLLATLVGATLAFGLAGAGGMYLTDPSLLLASRFAVGFASACMTTACMWGIGTEYDGHQRARALGISSGLGSIAALIGTVLGGFIAQRAGWRLSFAQFPAFAAVGLLLALISVRQVRPGRSSDTSVRSKPFLARLLTFYFLSTMLYAVMFMGSTQFAFLLQSDGVSSSSTRSLFIGAITVVGAATSLCYGALQKRLSATGAFALGLLSMTLSLATIGASSAPAYAAAGAVLMGVYVGITSPYVYHEVTERTTADVRGRAIGVLSAFCYLGAFLNPPVFAALSRWVGMRGVFLTAALGTAVLAAATAARLLSRRRAVRAG